MAVNMIGEAAHISGARPTSRRYREEMTSAERSNIRNAIWLCVGHSREIDRDEVKFTIELLHQIKIAHEKRCEHSTPSWQEALNSDLLTTSLDHSLIELVGVDKSDLFAIGPNITCLGELVGFDEGEWRFLVHHFVRGDRNTLVDFIGDFDQYATSDRYVLSNELGDGRSLQAQPSWAKERAGILVRCPVQPRSPRADVACLPSTWALTPDHDLSENWSTVSGLASLPQTIRSSLSLIRGESPMFKTAGSWLVDYYQDFRNSRWFTQIVKLEVIRHAAIPYLDPHSMPQGTPLQCIDRVYNVEALSDAPVKRWLPMRFDLEVHGLGRWQQEIRIMVEGKDRGLK
jgi:hypothetical protein